MADAGRVVAGGVRGLRLSAPGEGTRPLADRVKQALFAVLEAERPGVWSWPFLDLFAGSGAGGIEALSRGAPGAAFIERDPGAVRVIAENLRRTRLEGGAVVRSDVLRHLRAGSDEPFGAALVDPPYAEVGLLEATLALLGERALGWLREDGVVIAKHFWRAAPPPAAGSLRSLRVRRFGETGLTFYVVEPANRVAGPAEDPVADPVAGPGSTAAEGA